MLRMLLLLAISFSAIAQPAADLVRGISTSANELNAALTPDGRTMYFTRTAGANGRFGVILRSTLTNTGWSSGEVAEFSGRFSDYDPFVSPDDARLFFISNRPITGDAPKKDFDIWFVERTKDGWSAAQNIGAPVNSENDELYPAVASDGTLYFSSCGRSDSRGRCDLYRSRLHEGHYLAPENLGDAINTAASETDAYIAPDQSYILFAAYGRADAVGDGDLYISNFDNGSWAAPRPLAFANTVAREYCPIVSPDGKWFYFTSQFGFADAPRSRALTSSELRDSLHAIDNGFGNVYRVPMNARWNANHP